MDPEQKESRCRNGEFLRSSEQSNKKPYSDGPELIEWGSLLELTRGSLPGGVEDADIMSGTVGS
jgi:hypothetical protein